MSNPFDPFNTLYKKEAAPVSQPTTGGSRYPESQTGTDPVSGKGTIFFQPNTNTFGTTFSGRSEGELRDYLNQATTQQPAPVIIEDLHPASGVSLGTDAASSSVHLDKPAQLAIATGGKETS